MTELTYYKYFERSYPCGTAYKDLCGDLDNNKTSGLNALITYFLEEQNKCNELQILSNQENESFFNTYVLALQIITNIALGNIETATKLVDKLVKLPRRYAGFANAYFKCPIILDNSVDIYTGNNAWLLIALTHYKSKINNPAELEKITDIESKLVNFLLNQVTKSGVNSGYNPDGSLIPFRVTEANISTLAALNLYQEVNKTRVFNKVIKSIDNYLFNKCFNGNDFYSGQHIYSNEFQGLGTYFDNNLWYILATRKIDRQETVRKTLNCHLNRFKVNVIANITDQYLQGYSDKINFTRVFLPAFAYISMVNKEPINEQYKLFIDRGEGLGLPIVSNSGDWVNASINPNFECVCWHILAGLLKSPFSLS